MIDDFEAKVAAGRQRWPEMAMCELDAGARLDAALATGDVPGGVVALTDWIDARVAMAVYGDLPPASDAGRSGERA